MPDSSATPAGTSPSSTAAESSAPRASATAWSARTSPGCSGRGPRVRPEPRPPVGRSAPDASPTAGASRSERAGVRAEAVVDGIELATRAALGLRPIRRRALRAMGGIFAGAWLGADAAPAVEPEQGANRRGVLLRGLLLHRDLFGEPGEPIRSGGRGAPARQLHAILERTERRPHRRLDALGLRFGERGGRVRMTDLTAEADRPLAGHVPQHSAALRAGE